MKYITFILCVFLSFSGLCQEKPEEELRDLKKAKNLVYEGNALLIDEDHIAAEMEYRKAISLQPNFTVGTYNLGNSYYEKGRFDEALYRHQQAAKQATSKDEKHRIWHNIGNVLMQEKRCKEAVEAFKNALRNDPTDDETRYNFALAKECAEQQQGQDDQNEDDKEEEKEDEKEQEQEDKEQQEQDNENKENKPEEEGDQDEQEGEDKEDEEGKPNDQKEDQGKDGEEKKEKPQPRPGQLSPQQIKNLLEAMNDQEQKVQDKINEQKQKGVKVQTDKDW